MLGKLNKQRHTPIGLDLGASGAKMLQLAQMPGGWAVNACGRFDLPRTVPIDGPERQAAMTEGIRALLASSPFHGREVVSCLPVSAVQYKNVRMPQMPPAELKEAIQWEAPDRLQLGDQGSKVQHVEAGEVRQGEETRSEVILMGATDASLREHIHVVTGGGLKPVAIESTPIAMARCFARTIRRETDMDLGHVYVDVGRSCSKVLVLRGHNVSFFKLIEIGGQTLDEAVAERLSVSLDEASALRRRLSDEQDGEEGDGELIGSSGRDNVQRAVSDSVRQVVADLAREIVLCLRYYSVTFRGERPSVLYLVGGEAHDRQLVASLGEQLDLEVQIPDPLTGIDRSDPTIAIERRNIIPEWTVCAGLVMRRVHAGLRPMRGAA